MGGQRWGKMQNGQFTAVTHYDIIGGNFGTKSTLACTELTQKQFLSQWESLSYESHFVTKNRLWLVSTQSMLILINAYFPPNYIITW